mmetsp:Transcript_5200/g.22253  ORF Transcript_5200/g.22253 Transcript_5200/m.22253 type:complete len:247 (+) Transcript_5200:903-1643(+)
MSSKRYAELRHSCSALVASISILVDSSFQTEGASSSRTTVPCDSSRSIISLKISTMDAEISDLDTLLRYQCSLLGIKSAQASAPLAVCSPHPLRLPRFTISHKQMLSRTSCSDRGKMWKAMNSSQMLICLELASQSLAKTKWQSFSAISSLSLSSYSLSFNILNATVQAQYGSVPILSCYRLTTMAILLPTTRGTYHSHNFGPGSPHLLTTSFYSKRQIPSTDLTGSLSSPNLPTKKPPTSFEQGK